MRLINTLARTPFSLHIPRTRRCLLVFLMLLAACSRQSGKRFQFMFQSTYSGPFVIAVKDVSGTLMRETKEGYEIQVNDQGLGWISTADLNLMSSQWAAPSVAINAQDGASLPLQGDEYGMGVLWRFIGSKAEADAFFYGRDSLDARFEVLKRHGLDISKWKR